MLSILRDFTSFFGEKSESNNIVRLYLSEQAAVKWLCCTASDVCNLVSWPSQEMTFKSGLNCNNPLVAVSVLERYYSSVGCLVVLTIFWKIN